MTNQVRGSGEIQFSVFSGQWSVVSGQWSVVSGQNLKISSFPIRLIRLIRDSQSSFFLKRV
jgi:hypothetical protein